MFNEGRGGPQLLRIYTLFNLTPSDFRFKLSFGPACTAALVLSLALADVLHPAELFTLVSQKYSSKLIIWIRTP